MAVTSSMIDPVTFIPSIGDQWSQVGYHVNLLVRAKNILMGSRYGYNSVLMEIKHESTLKI